MLGSVCVCMRTMEKYGSLVVFEKEHEIITAETNDNDYIYAHILKLLLKALHLPNRIH
jgi:hypothetical protein